jgi:hypothetical protein
MLHRFMVARTYIRLPTWQVAALAQVLKRTANKWGNITSAIQSYNIGYLLSMRRDKRCCGHATPAGGDQRHFVILSAAKNH